MTLDTRNPRIYLASRSPRRRELLMQVGIRFDTIAFRNPPLYIPNGDNEYYVVVRFDAGDGNYTDQLVKIIITGALQPGVMARDVFHHLVRVMGPSSCAFKVVELAGPVIDAMSMWGLQRMKEPIAKRRTRP